MKRSEVYIARLLQQNPKTTISGIPIQIVEGGKYVYTYSGRSLNGEYSVYMPCDYPKLFGWSDPTSMPWPYGTRVLVKGVSPDVRGGNIGKVVSFRFAQNGSIDYRIIRWRNNTWWVNETGLELVAEPTLLGASADVLIVEDNDMEESREPTLEERVEAIEKHLGIKITREPAKVVVTETNQDAENN